MNNDNLEIAKILVEKCSRIKMTSDAGKTSFTESSIGEKFLTASQNHDLATLTEILTTTPVEEDIINYQEREYGYTALHKAVRSQEDDLEEKSTLATVDLLLNNKANIDLTYEKYGETALYLTSFFNKKKTALLLLERGADINLVDNVGRTALYKACLLYTSPSPRAS